MPLITLSFDPDRGAFLTVGFATPASLRPQGQAPFVRAVSLLIDTGAMRTSISPAIATEFGLPILGQTTIRSATHEVPVNEYLADLIWTVPKPPVPLPDFRVLEFPMAGSGCDGLLGRDILRFGLVSMNGPDKSITLAF